MMKLIKELNWAMIGFVLLSLFLAKFVYWDCFILIFGKVGTIKIYILVAVALAIFIAYDLKVLEPRRIKKESSLGLY